MSTIEVIFLSAAVITFATGLPIVAINPSRTINKSCFAASTLSAIWLFCIFMAVHIGRSADYESRHEDILFWLRMTNAVAAFLPCSYLVIKMAIVDSVPTSNPVNRLWPWILASSVLATLAFSESFIPAHSTPEDSSRGIGYTAYTWSQSVMCILIAFDALKGLPESSGMRQLELKFFVINFCIATLVSLFAFIAGNTLKLPFLRYIAPFVVVTSVGLMIWATCYHRVFDARQVFAAIARRVSSLIVLAGSVVVVDSFLSDLLSAPFALFLAACCGGVTALFWDGKVHRWLGLDASQLLEKPRAEVIELARREIDADKLTSKLENFLRQWCQATSASIHIANRREPSDLIPGTFHNASDFVRLRQNGYVTADTLARHRPDKEMLASKALLAERHLAALIAVPRGSHTPSCVVALGPKRSLRPYTHPDIQLLIELIELIDNILAQAHAANQAAQLERIESAALMSRGLAHDLNNLATPVATFLLHVEDRIAAGTAEAEVFAHAKHSIDVMQEYIRESLFFARKHVPDFQNLSMGELLSSTVKLTQTRAQARGVTLTIAAGANFAFTADKALMLRLMQNLVRNGIDATPRGGCVTLSGGILENDRVILRVTDQGPGVPSELMDRIFEPYFTTKGADSEIRGLGLGLAISKKIGDLHGGKLCVERAPSGGAIFSFIAPPNPTARSTTSKNQVST